jgi:hypothetical protein
MHRRRIAIDLKARTGFDCRSSIAQIEQDIAGRRCVGPAVLTAARRAVRPGSRGQEASGRVTRPPRE